MTEFLSRTVSLGTGAIDVFTLDFEYLNRTHVKVAIDGELYTGVITFLSPTSIQLDHMPADGAEVVRYRQTPLEELLASLAGKSTFNSQEADLINKQLLYLIQEATDLGLSPTIRVPQFISFMVTENFAVNEICGPYVVPFPMQLPLNLSGSQFAVPVNPSSPHTFSIRKNGVQIGTLAIATNGTVTPTFASSTSFAIGDSLTLVTTLDGGLTNFGCNLKMILAP
jgi:hypothetical protein